MIRSHERSPKTAPLSLAALVIGSFLAAEKSTQAGLTLDSSFGTISYGIYSTTHDVESPTFNGPMLIYPGGNLPVLTSGSLTQNSSSSLSPYFLSDATTNPGSPIGSVPAVFGNAATESTPQLQVSKGASRTRAACSGRSTRP